MKRVIAATLLLSVFASSVTLADDRDHRRDHGRQSYERNHHDRDYRRHDHDRYNDRRHDRNHYDRDHRHYSDHRYEVRRPYNHHRQEWRRGAYLPHSYRRPVYVVNDYHVHHLRRPPHGYHWVRVNRDIVLTALATGLILEAVYDRY